MTQPVTRPCLNSHQHGRAPSGSLSGVGLLALASVAVAPLLATPAQAALQSTEQARGGPVQLQRDDDMALVQDSRLFSATIAGRLARNADDPILAARAFERAADARPDDMALLRRATDAWIDAGQPDQALRLARRLPANARSGPAALVLAVDAIQRRRPQDVSALFVGPAWEPGDRLLATALEAAAHAMRRRWDEALALTADLQGTRGASRAAMAARGLVLEQSGNRDGALLAYGTAWNNGQQTVGVTWLKARAEAAAGNRTAALATLEQGIAASGQVPLLMALKAQIEAGRVPRLPDIRETAVWSLFLIGEAQASDARGTSPVTALSLALYLRPEFDEARVPLAAWLVARGRVSEALLRLEEITPRSGYYVDAVITRAWLMRQRGEVEASGTLLRTAATGSTVPRMIEARAAFDLMDGRYADAVAGYTVLIDGAAAAGAPNQVLAGYFYGRGTALEALDRWPEAERDLRRAVELQPRNASYLNGLGYGLADRNQNLPEALRLLRQAARLDPRNGAIIDSLGWAHYRAGNYEEAVSTLERAVMLAPASPEIIDHLGDAYWKAGRQNDARIEWRKALGLRPPPALAARIEAKLAQGLDAVEAAERASATPAAAS